MCVSPKESDLCTIYYANEPLAMQVVRLHNKVTQRKFRCVTISGLHQNDKDVAETQTTLNVASVFVRSIFVTCLRYSQ